MFRIIVAAGLAVGSLGDSPQGQESWMIDAANGIALVQGDDGTVYGTDNTGDAHAYDITKLRKDGHGEKEPHVKWTYSIPTSPDGRQSISSGKPILDSAKGALYFGTTAWDGEGAYLYKVSTKGKLINRKMFPIGAQSFEYVTLSSPYVAAIGNTGDGSGDAHVYLFNTTSDELIPMYDHTIKGGEGGWRLSFVRKPVVDKEGTVYVASENRVVYAIAKDGQRRWEYVSSTTTGPTPPAPAWIAVESNVVYVVAKGQNCGTPGSCTAVTLDAKTGKVLRTMASVGESGQQLLTQDGFCLASGSSLTCFNKATGAVLWSANVTFSDPGQPPLLDPQGVMYVVDGVYGKEEKAVVALKDGKEIWRKKHTSQYYSSCRYATDDTVYCRIGPALYAHSTRDGKELWHLSGILGSDFAFFDQHGGDIAFCDGQNPQCWAYSGPEASDVLV